MFGIFHGQTSRVVNDVSMGSAEAKLSPETKQQP